MQEPEKIEQKKSREKNSISIKILLEKLKMLSSIMQNLKDKLNKI